MSVCMWVWVWAVVHESKGVAQFAWLNATCARGQRKQKNTYTNVKKSAKLRQKEVW